ncbi:voltage-dependent calcium channel subunit alpha-2/delta-3-like isoform X2 [Euwallacea fornicatus]|uniref:voltage-dependent calcium channel subunit alpha-2/delta-3-like isoform X2 n=1 Tax=Euwallacea fornicatus TaxID=995702 RepID=UPI00338F42AC
MEIFNFCIVFYGTTILFRSAIAYGSDPKKIDNAIRAIQKETVDLVEIWSEEIGRKLLELSNNMTRVQDVKKNFRHLQNHLYKIDGVVLTEDVASDIRIFMENKVDAVRRIADYAEFLSYYRRDDQAYKNETRDRYYYFDVDGIENSEETIERSMEISEDIFNECEWWCAHKHLTNLTYNIFNSESSINQLFEKRDYQTEDFSCDCDNLMEALHSRESYTNLPLKYEPHFETSVNLNVSAVKVATNIFERDMTVLEGIRWSEPLDLVFKRNYYADSDLVWQYFASPSGFMRHYPAVQWSDERYYQTYDFRTRSWFTEAMTSPKDIIILLDQSGSMKGLRRKLSHQIVNDILDTLNDNDFVNIYTFNNVTSPLVDCFNDTLFQANEENLRLLREYLPVYQIEFVANISLGLEKAFKLLAYFRQTNLTSNCNQAIMLITEGIDYDYDISIFNRSNWIKNFPVRIFTYLLGTEKEDEKQMEFIACSNMGYYVNMTEKPDIREKVLKYLKVMSRPINFCYNDKQSPIWSYLYVDLADRRLSNWLWNKFEGIRQREVFLDHVKRRADRLQFNHNSVTHMLLQETHVYGAYEEKQNYTYMTTVSLPVYGRRGDEYNLTGVAGVDVPIKFFRARIPYNKIGVNGYAFIITNNGYILMHPEHRTEFEYILKPTFNRVDILETEILDDENEPRIFGADIVRRRSSTSEWLQLREKMLKRQGKKATLNIKYTLDDMKRIIRARRHYYYTDIGPFTLCIVMPDQYGVVKVNKSRVSKDPPPETILNYDNWAAHPDWIYCKNCPPTHKKTLEQIEYAYYHPSFRNNLYHDLMHDIEKTSWFNDDVHHEKKFVDAYYMHKIFLSTNSGLTRWKTFNRDIYQNIYDEAEPASNRSIDEDWYQRSVEENLKNEDMFIFSVPFEISGYENNTMIRGTKAIFVEKGNMKTPVAVVGLEFNHQAMYKLYNSITTKPRAKKGGKKITCESDYLNCFILDNNAYILLSDEIEYTGRFIGDIRPDIMYYLVKENVYESTRMFDYQASCQNEPPESPDPGDKKCFKKATKKKKNSSPKIDLFLKSALLNLLQTIKWAFNLLLYTLGYIHPLGEDVLKLESKIFETLKVKKTVPTPCDREMWLFTLKKGFRSSFYNNDSIKFNCNWSYVVKEIPNTNLIFLAISNCPMTTSHTYPHTPEPMKINYYSQNVKVSLPCYIATMNNYTREPYMKCYKRDEREDKLNQMDKNFCGHTWD